MWLPVLTKMGPAYDVKTRDGNFNAAMYVFRIQGRQAWKRGDGGKLIHLYQPVLYEAKRDEWTPVQGTPVAFIFASAEDVEVCFNHKCTDPNFVKVAGPEKVIQRPNTVSVEFRAINEDMTPVVFMFTGK